MNLDNLLAKRGLSLRRTHNLIQVRGANGTVYQSHNKTEIAMWLMGVGIFVTVDNPALGDVWETDSHTCARKYGRTTSRP